jgi:uncharacterized protein (DUF2062 family)
MNFRKIKPVIAGKLHSFKRIGKMDGDPHQIASGYSLGIFIGMMPLVGVKAFMAVGIASLLKWNKLAAGIGVFNINPLTAPFIFGLNYLVGRQVTGCSHSFNFSTDFSLQFFRNLFVNGTEILLTLAVGGVLLGIPFAFAAYHASFFIVNKYRKQD